MFVFGEIAKEPLDDANEADVGTVCMVLSADIAGRQTGSHGTVGSLRR